MEDNFRKEKNKFNCEKLYNPNIKNTTQLGCGFGRRRFTKVHESEKIEKKEESTIRKIEEKTPFVTKYDERLGKSRKNIEQPKKEEKNEHYSKYEIVYTTTIKPKEKQKEDSVKFVSRGFNKSSDKFENVELKKVKEIKKEEPKKEEASYKRNYFREYSRGNEKEKKEEKPSEMAYTRQYKKAYIKLDDNKNEEKSEQSFSYYRRFYKRQNTENNNVIKDNRNKKENIENKKNRFVYRRQYSKNNTNEDKNTKKENSRIKYNNPYGGNLTSASITSTNPITKDIRAPTTYVSRGKIQKQKEINQEEIIVKIKINNKKISDKKQETYNYKDPFSIALTDQKKIEESLNNFKKINNIEEYYNMLLIF